MVLIFNKILPHVLGLCILLLFTACYKDLPVTKDVIKLPPGFPAIDHPQDNKPTESRIKLGKALFEDPVLSHDSTISCSSCHFSPVAFSDTIGRSFGINGKRGHRNASPLFNLAYHEEFMRDGSIPTLEMQILAPISNEKEMGSHITEATERLLLSGIYDQLSQTAYNRPVSDYVITRAISCYLRSLISGNSSYDSLLLGQTELSISAQKGMNLFFSERTNCSNCHNGFNFTNNSYENIGLYYHYMDSGRFNVTFKDRDLGKFKVPSLRNLKYTSPYMHNGSKTSLKDIITHYNYGGQAHPNKSEHVKGLGLSSEEIEQLIDFLNSLNN